MTPYDRRAFEKASTWKSAQISANKKGWLPGPIKEIASTVSKKTNSAWTRLPGHLRAEKAIKDSAAGSFRALCQLGDASLDRQRVIADFQRSGFDLHDLEGIRKIDLSSIDRVMPRLSTFYSLGSGAAGAISGAVMGGATMSGAASGAATGGATALPSVAVVVGTLATDVAALVASAFRAVSHHAAYHGFDTRNSSEFAFAMGVIQAASANSQLAKQAAFIDLQRITALVAKKATWDRLNREPFLYLANEFHARLHRRLIKRKIAQITIVVGVLIGFGANYKFLSEVSDHAYHLYRERFLAEKYGLAP